MRLDFGEEPVVDSPIVKVSYQTGRARSTREDP
jgi:hypothetical protein